MQTRYWALGFAICLTAVSTAGRAAVTEDNFQLRNAGDLVALCSASPSETLGTAALNFCHGFGVGVFRVLQKQDAAARSRHPLFCIPNPQPTRNEAVAGFVRWANAEPARLSLPAADAVAASLAAQYPCRRGQ